MFIDIYAIQNVPPCNINRDDTGSPKTTVYGGVPRARVSSQAWKHAMRAEFQELLPDEPKLALGVRTKKAVQLIADKICEINPKVDAEESIELTKQVFTTVEIKFEESKNDDEDEGKEEVGSDKTKYLIFIAPSEIEGLAKLALSWKERGIFDTKLTKAKKTKLKNEFAEVFHGIQAIDIALFGRMLADAPAANTDACAQVAHAISVDEVVTDYDYFTALDDCAPADNTGAAMIDTIAFNTSTLYRYATVNLDALNAQLGDAAASAAGVKAFVEAFVRSMPTGKQNTFANRTLPSAVYVAMREKQPVNAVSAFEVPVRAENGKSISYRAAEKLGDQLAGFDDVYGTTPVKAWTVVVGKSVESLKEIGESVTLDGMLDGLYAQAFELLSVKE